MASRPTNICEVALIRTHTCSFESKPFVGNLVKQTVSRFVQATLHQLSFKLMNHSKVKDLVIWAPSELAVMFGADPAHPVLPLKIRKAFYGLVHAPRAWYNHVVKDDGSQGWVQLIQIVASLS